VYDPESESAVADTSVSSAKPAGCAATTGPPSPWESTTVSSKEFARGGGAARVRAGAHRIEEPHYFRLEGPVTLIKFDNTEYNANHVHCLGRDPTNDFGNDILAQHRGVGRAGLDQGAQHTRRACCRASQGH
jgi:hypothetical protein